MIWHLEPFFLLFHAVGLNQSCQSLSIWDDLPVSACFFRWTEIPNGHARGCHSFRHLHLRPKLLRTQLVHALEAFLTETTAWVSKCACWFMDVFMASLWLFTQGQNGYKWFILKNSGGTSLIHLESHVDWCFWIKIVPLNSFVSESLETPIRLIHPESCIYIYIL